MFRFFFLTKAKMGSFIIQSRYMAICPDPCVTHTKTIRFPSDLDATFHADFLAHFNYLTYFNFLLFTRKFRGKLVEILQENSRWKIQTKSFNRVLKPLLNANRKKTLKRLATIVTMCWSPKIIFLYH